MQTSNTDRAILKMFSRLMSKSWEVRKHLLGKGMMGLFQIVTVVWQTVDEDCVNLSPIADGQWLLWNRPAANLPCIPVIRCLFLFYPQIGMVDLIVVIIF